jgi:hypothetical protein
MEKPARRVAIRFSALCTIEIDTAMGEDRAGPCSDQPKGESAPDSSGSRDTRSNSPPPKSAQLQSYFSICVVGIARTGYCVGAHVGNDATPSTSHGVAWNSAAMPCTANGGLESGAGHARSMKRESQVLSLLHTVICVTLHVYIMCSRCSCCRPRLLSDIDHRARIGPV